jgi:G3E family GTPase
MKRFIAAPIPVTVLTGFLGSGKTTLLQRLLTRPEARATAVLINEIGEIGLDHLLASPVGGPASVLADGCACCALRSDLEQGLVDLVEHERRPFDRIVIETTGLADPVPIADLVVNHPRLRQRLRYASTVTTIDAVHGGPQLDRHAESVRQAAIADRLVVTKGDVSGKAEVARLVKRLKSLNRLALVLNAQAADFDLASLLADSLEDPATRLNEVKSWLRARNDLASGLHEDHGECEAHAHDGPHDPHVRTFAVRADVPIEWPALALWLNSLVRRYGSKILRIKGLLNIAGASGPMVLHGIEHVIHPLVALEAWPDDDTSSRIVFVVQGVDPRPIQGSLKGLLERRRIVRGNATGSSP